MKIKKFMNLDKKTKYILAVSVQVLVILIIIIFKYSILSGGSAVYLEILPVDPRDPLRGDYVTFQYEISNLNRYLFNYQPKNGDIVYIPLVQRGSYWIAQSGISNDESAMTGKLFIKGRVVSGGMTNLSNSKLYNENNFDAKIGVKYGIEEYFIPEGIGRNFSFFNKNVKGKVMIDDHGNAVIQEIYINDKLWP